MKKFRGIFKKKKEALIEPAEAQVQANNDGSMAFSNLDAVISQMSIYESPKPPALPRRKRLTSSDYASEEFNQDLPDETFKAENELPEIPLRMRPGGGPKNQQKPRKKRRNKRRSRFEPPMIGSNFSDEPKESSFTNFSPNSREPGDMELHQPSFNESPTNPAADANRMAVKPKYNMFGVRIDYAQIETSEVPHMMNARTPPATPARARERFRKGLVRESTNNSSEEFDVSLSKMFEASSKIKRQVAKKPQRRVRRKKKRNREGNSNNQNDDSYYSPNQHMRKLHISL